MAWIISSACSKPALQFCTSTRAPRARHYPRRDPHTQRRLARRTACPPEGLVHGNGWAGWLEVHPFTIASVSKTEEGMVLLVKNTGGWTRKMYEVANTSGYVGDGLGQGYEGGY